MLSKNVLNGVIVLSILSLLGLQLKDMYFQSQKRAPVVSENISPTSPVPQDAVIIEKKDAPCSSSYFPFTKGTRLNYTLLTQADITPDAKPTKKMISYEITQMNTTSIILNRLTTNKKYTLYCKEDGIYGLPLDLNEILGPLASIAHLASSQTESIGKKFLLIPTDTILDSQSYSVDYMMPGLLGASQKMHLDYVIDSPASGEKNLTLSARENKQETSEQVPFQMGGSSYADYLKGIKLNYTLKKGLGVTSLDFSAAISSLSIKTTLTLSQPSSSR